MERKNSRKVAAGLLLGSALAGQVSLGASRAEACVAPCPVCVEGPLVTMGGTLWVMEKSCAVTSFVIRKIINRGKILGTSGDSPE